MLGCERCGVEVGYDDQSNAEIRLQEVAMQFGITTFLCYECRKAWNKFSFTHELFQKYSEAGFRLRCWQVLWRKRPGEMKDAEEGIKFLQAVTTMDKELYNLVDNWIKAGITKAEAKRRESTHSHRGGDDGDDD